MSKNKHLTLVSLVLGFTSAIVIAEVIVRLFFPGPIVPRFVIDPGYGVRANQPNVKTQHSVPGEYQVTITTNSIGMRGQKEYEIENPKAHRVVMLGDSFIYGHGVNDHEVVSHVLEEKLNMQTRHDQLHYEVLNFSVSGFGQAEELVTYTKQASFYKPDDVVLFYFDNDIGNNAVSRLFEIKSDGTLRRTNNSYLPGVKAREILYGIAPVRWLFGHSQAWNLIRNRLSSIVQKSLLSEQGLTSFKDSQPKAAMLTKALLIKFIAKIKKDGARPILFVIPHKTLPSNFPLTNEEVTNTGALVIYGEDFLEKSDYYNRDSHWRPIGHRKAAEELQKVIMGQIQ